MGLLQAQAKVEPPAAVRSFRKSIQIEKMAKDVTPGNTSVCSTGRETEFWQKRDEIIREIGERPEEWSAIQCQGRERAKEGVCNMIECYREGK